MSIQQNSCDVYGILKNGKVLVLKTKKSSLPEYSKVLEGGGVVKSERTKW